MHQWPFAYEDHFALALGLVRVSIDLIEMSVASGHMNGEVGANQSIVCATGDTA